MEVLVGTDLSVASHGELSDAATAAARLQAFVDHAKVQIARRGRDLAEQVLAAVSPGPASAREPEIVVHTDAGSMCHGRHADTLCETIDGDPVPVATMQWMCCEAILHAVAVRPDGTVDEICAEHRTANRQQRRMLAAMYRTCAHPHCEIGYSRCRIHHIEWFTRGGTTVLADLLPLCETHHHLVHEGGWNLTIDDRRRLTGTKPDGTIWRRDTGPPRTRSRRARRPSVAPPADAA